MARAPRIEFEGAVYHITARGYERRLIYRSVPRFFQFLDMKHRFRLISTLIFLACFHVSVAWADIAYTTLSASLTYDGSNGNRYNIHGPNYGYAGYAVSFVPTISGDLSSIDMGVVGYEGVEAAFFFSLTANNPSGGPLVTDSLTSGWLEAPTFAWFTPDSQLATFDFTGPPVSLSSGVTYWLVLGPMGGGTIASWALNSGDIYSTMYYSSDGNSYIYPNVQKAPAFQVNVIPEPSTCILFTIGAMGLLFKRHRHSLPRRQRRLPPRDLSHEKHRGKLGVTLPFLTRILWK